MGSQGEPTRPEPDIQQLLTASKYYLFHRNFAKSLKYADKAQQVNPNLPGLAHIVAISSVLSVAPSAFRPESPDWYSILNLPRFTDDPNLIRTRFDSLAGLLNPEKTPYPFAAEAHGWVLKARSVLSNPNSKAHFDKELKMKQKSSENGGGTFWTLCPYCYFMYEYKKVYEDRVLRCQNAKCRRAFTAVAVAEAAAPPPEVVEEGKYFCHGFSPLGPNNEMGGDSGEGKGNKWWAPFVYMGSGSGQVNEKSKAEVKSNEGLKSENNDRCIEISDDEVQGEERVEKRADDKGDNGVKVVMKRKKMAAKCKKKLMGKGIRVQSAEVKQENAKASGKMEGCIGDELEFSAGEDDIFVALRTDGEFEVGKL